MIRHTTRERPDRCPWRDWQDPLVQDVIRVYGAREAGLQEALVGGSWSRAPAKFGQALRLFDAAYRRSADAERKRRRKAKAKARDGGSND